MITSKLTAKAQTTIPQAVGNALGLRVGDKLAYAIENGRIILTRAGGEANEDTLNPFHEWDGDADRKAYATL